MKHWERFTIYLIYSHIIYVKAVAAGSETNCTVLLDVFANATSEFTACAIYNSRPITLCEECIKPYMNVVDSYQNMTKFSDNATLCIDNFINLDRLQIVKTLYRNSYNLWNSAKCYECYQSINGSLSPNKSEETITFNNYLNTFMKCLNRTDVNDTNICPTCIQDYINLDSYYQSISNENEKIGMCMDLVDLMNSTRSYWSLKCCEYRKHPEYIFLSSTVMILITTLLFYIAAQYFTEKRTPTILQQTRFAGSLNQQNHS